MTKDAKTIKPLEYWFVQMNSSGTFCLCSVYGTRTTSIQKDGKSLKEFPDLKRGDFVETKNTIYKLGTPAFPSDIFEKSR